MNPHLTPRQRRARLNMLDGLDLTGCAHHWSELGPSTRHHIGIPDRRVWQCGRCNSTTTNNPKDSTP